MFYCFLLNAFSVIFKVCAKEKKQIFSQANLCFSLHELTCDFVSPSRILIVERKELKNMIVKLVCFNLMRT